MSNYLELKVPVRWDAEWFARLRERMAEEHIAVRWQTSYHHITVAFINNHEVRAVWDEEHNQWWFSIVDIVGAITESPNPRKYWSVLKTRLKRSENELTTRCSQLKMTAADGKRYATDCFAQEDIVQLVRVIPSKKTEHFLDWFVYSDNTIDGQSKKKAYTLIESRLLENMKPGTVKCLQQIHAFLFGGLYDFAGKIRTKTISKGNTIFCLAEHLHNFLKTVEAMPDTTFDEIVDKYVEMNMAHPFMEGNGRSTRIWLDLLLKGIRGTGIRGTGSEGQELLYTNNEVIYKQEKIDEK